MITESSAAHRGPVVRFSIFVWYARHLVAAWIAPKHPPAVARDRRIFLPELCGGKKARLDLNS
jgi:hypothetical protein